MTAEALKIGLDSWIIQDGNYSDFEMGREYEFALEFYARDVQITADSAKYLLLLAGSDYRFGGAVLVADPSVTVLDVGILCFQDGKAPFPAQSGNFVSGELYLGVDPFFWFETHSRVRGRPGLFYRWRVRRILLETTPWIESQDDAGRTVTRRADVERTFEEVQRTDAWSDDEGNANYILGCELLGQCSRPRPRVRRIPGSGGVSRPGR